MRTVVILVAAMALVGAGCGGSPSRRAVPGPTSPPASAVPSDAPPATQPTVRATPRPSPRPMPTPAGTGPAWPSGRRTTAAPPALGAVETRRAARISSGGTLAAGLVLPRLGGTARAPLVMTPCGRRVILDGDDVVAIAPGDGAALPKPGDRVLVVVDPGHGGRQTGAVSPQGDREKDRVLLIAREVRRTLAGRVGRVVLTRDRDMEATLPFRVALADALRADAAVSVHLNAAPDGPRDTPGLETFASVADPAGRRFAGVMYAAQRRYLDTLPGPWVGDRDAGAKYRLNVRGTDYYALLRNGHRPWVISESMYISSGREAELVARPDVRRDLGQAIADGITAFTTTAASGSGWVTPYPRPADPSGGGASGRCVDPSG